MKKGEKVTVDVPIYVTGESKPDAMTVTELNTVTVEAEATNIPEYIEVSVEDAEVGFQIFARDLELPAGSTLLTDEDYLIVNVVHAPQPRRSRPSWRRPRPRPASSATTPTRRSPRPQRPRPRRPTAMRALTRATPRAPATDDES